MRAIDDPGRILGLDVARGLAVLGMFGAHLGVPDDLLLGDPASWTALVHGRSSILFAVLAGISVALLSGGRNGVSRHPDARRYRTRGRVRIVVRAFVIFVIGIGLSLLDTPVAVILMYYAVMFVFALPLLGLRPRTLFVLAAVWAVVAPALVVVLAAVADGYGVPRDDIVLDLLVTGSYPVLTWMAFLLFGMAVGRLDLTSRALAVRLVLVGAVLAFVGYAVGIATAEPFGAGMSLGGGPGAPGQPEWASLFGAEAHSGTTFEVVGSTGVAAAVIGACLLVPRRARPVLFPVESIGAMALSAYSIHIIAYAVVFPAGPSEWAWLWFALVALVLCPLWRLTIGRGPIEYLLTLVSSAAAPAAAAGATPARPSP